MAVIQFHNNQDIVVSTNTQIGEKSVTMKVVVGVEYEVLLEPQGDMYTDITFGIKEKFPVIAFLIPNESFKVIL